jgi:hypothetical protein
MVSLFISIFYYSKIYGFFQGRREGVKGVTVSRGPGLKRGPGNHGNKRKIMKYKKLFQFGPQICRILGPYIWNFSGRHLRQSIIDYTLRR